ncbi:DUF3899 domain-containing protein [Sediminibacillus dalangtanensis]|uniref:DUF3899 domain-containing protein n=1 Tax=Sediminibacillus dalangtanensis TaxID=2729421 RepID=A0ABX7VSV2_9BACI|nr:DUF3899 domain-containing protein [Sediminibacillus dalangtanensis]QTM98685.1 DUF3899 domain-containing protein [Sediminibacillus dalangtanensis]
MKVLQNKWALLGINLAVGLAFFLIAAPALQLEHLINILFYFGACWLFVGIFLWIVHGGFFDGVVYGFRKSFERSFKRRDYLSDNDTVPSEKVSISFVKAACFQGIGLLILMLFLLAWFYAG